LNFNFICRDWHEGIDLYKEITPDQAALLPSSPIHGLNPWPTQIPSFKKALNLYISSCLDLGAALMRGIALGLNIPEHSFEGERAGDSYWVTRVIHYPPLPLAPSMRSTSNNSLNKNSSHHTTTNGTASMSSSRGLDNMDSTIQDAISCGAHTDYGLLTIVNQDDDPDLTALQVLNGKGEWIDAPPLPGTFVCNIGDMLRIWTNGMYRPTLHRVVHKHCTKSRISIPFFYEPNYEAIVKPFPELVAVTNEPEIAGVRYGSHLEAKVLNNFKFDSSAAEREEVAGG
jgi:isopenicillin N synthase-like dioxygenase